MFGECTGDVRKWRAPLPHPSPGGTGKGGNVRKNVWEMLGIGGAPRPGQGAQVQYNTVSPASPGRWGGGGEGRFGKCSELVGAPSPTPSPGGGGASAEDVWNMFGTGGCPLPYPSTGGRGRGGNVQKMFGKRAELVGAPPAPFSRGKE